MTSRLLTALLLALLALWLWRFGRAEDARVAPVEAGAPLYPGLEPASVDFLSLRFRGGHVADFQREAGGPWRITYPPEVREPAQAEFVERVLENLALASVLPVEGQGAEVDPADVALERPELSVTFGIGGERHTLFVGDKEVFGQGIYARREGDEEIVLTSPSIRTMLEQFRAEDYVDKHLLRGLRGSVQRVRVTRPEGVLLDAELTGGGWVLREPVAGRADDARLTQLVRNLQFSQQVLVAAVAPGPEILDQLGLPDAVEIGKGDLGEATVIELHAPGEPPARLFLQRDWIATEDAMYAVREDLYKLLEVDRNEFNLLTNEPEFFRESRVLPPVRERASRVRIEAGGAPLLDIQRGAQGSWRFSEPRRLAGLAVDTERIEGRSSLSDFLQRIDGLDASGFCAPPGGQPALRMRIEFDAAGRTGQVELELFEADGGDFAATVSDRPGEGLVLPQESTLALSDPFLPDSLRDLAPLALEDGAWVRLSIALPAAPEALEITRGQDGAWAGDDEWGRRFGLGHDLLAGFRGYAWRARRDIDPACSVAFLGVDGAVLARLTFRAPAADEPREFLGVPVDLAWLESVPEAELVVPVFWRQRLEALLTPQEREPLPTVPISGPPGR